MSDFRKLCEEILRVVDGLPWQYDWQGNPVGPLAHVDEEPFERARAALAAAPAPVVGDAEVAALVAALRDPCVSPLLRERTRAADLLERASTPAPAPVPVSERLPGAEDCDAEGRCWFFTYDNSWMLEDRTYGCNSGRTHWLPFSALPLPEVAP